MNNFSSLKNELFLQRILLHNFKNTKVELSYPGVAIESVTQLESPNYLFINLKLSPDVQPGQFTINFKKGKKVKATYNYTLNQRVNDPNLYQGFDNSDVIYLLMPDRFANSTKRHSGTRNKNAKRPDSGRAHAKPERCVRCFWPLAGASPTNHR